MYRMCACMHEGFGRHWIRCVKAGLVTFAQPDARKHVFDVGRGGDRPAREVLVEGSCSIEHREEAGGCASVPRAQVLMWVLGCCMSHDACLQDACLHDSCLHHVVCAEDAV